MTGQHDGEDLYADHIAACGKNGAGSEQRLAAEGEVAVARLAMDGGDLAHAAGHLGFAIGTDPQLPEAHEALAELVARCGSVHTAMELFPMQRPYIGAVACRAYLCATAGEWADAIGLLVSVIQAEPALPWAHATWLGRPDLPSLLAPDVTANAIARLLGNGLPIPLPADLYAAILPFYELVRAMVAHYPEAPTLLVMASGLARRFADHDSAIGWAEQAQRVAPGHMPSMMLGYALREAGRPTEALRVWEDELSRDPSDLSLHVDVAELYATIGRAAEGLPWVERALAVDPDHPQAAPAVHGVRHAIDGSTAHLVALADHLRAHPEHNYAETVLAKLCRDQRWLGRVHPATEATMNVLHQVLEAGSSKPDHEIQLAISALEPPSSLMAFKSVFPLAEAVYNAVGEPDPRVPSHPVSFQAWEFDGLTARAAVAEPSAEASELIRAVARLSWPHPPAAYDHAVRLSGLSLPDLLGALVHPPRPRDDEQGRFLAATMPDLWIRAVQTFACLGITHHRADEPWLESERRSVLFSLLSGPEDWVSEAAGMALVAVAWVDPDAREDIGMRITDRMLAGAKAYQTREVTILGSLCALTLACPWLPETFTSTAQKMLDAIKARDAQQPEDAEERGQEMIDLARASAQAPQPAQTQVPPQVPPQLGPRRRLFGRRS